MCVLHSTVLAFIHLEKTTPFHVPESLAPPRSKSREFNQKEFGCDEQWLIAWRHGRLSVCHSFNSLIRVNQPRLLAFLCARQAISTQI